MFEAYVIGATIRLHNLVSPQLALLAKEFEKLETLTLSLNKSLGKISLDSKGLRSLATATNATNRAFEKATLSAGAYESRLAAIHRLGALGASPLAPPRVPITPRLPPPGGGGGGNRYGAGGFHGGNIHMGPGGIGLGTVGMAAGDWFVPLAATGAMIYAGKSLFDSAKELDTERQRFKLFGLSDAQNNEAFKFAGGMHIYGSTQTENMRNFREAQGVFREAGVEGSAALEGAKLAAPILSKLNALDASLDDESAARSHSSNLAMLRYVESAGGLKSQAEFNRLANIGYKLKVGSGDTVDWQQLQQFQKRGGSSAINITGEGMARIEPSISTLGGSTTGTALATAFGRLQGIVKNLPVPVIDELLKNGVWDRKKVELNSRGGIAKFLDPRGPLSAENSKLLSENPEGFYEKVIRPIYAKMNLDAAGVIRQNALIYGRTGGALANEWEKQLATIARALDAFNKTKDIAGATKQLPDSLTGQQKEFDAAWTDFKTDFGTVMLPFFSGILKGGSSVLRAIHGASPEATAGTATLTMAGAMALTGNPSALISMGSDALRSDTLKSYVSSLFGSSDRGPRKLGFDADAAPMFGNPLDKEGGSPFVKPGAQQPVTVHTQINLDGRKVAQTVTKHQVNFMASQGGMSGFDPSQMLPASGSGN